MEPAELDPRGLHPAGGQDDRGVGVDLADALDELLRAVGLAGDPGVVDEDVGVLGHGADTAGQDRAARADRPQALLDGVAAQAERIRLVVGEIDVVVDEQDPGHRMPP